MMRKFHSARSIFHQMGLIPDRGAQHGQAPARPKESACAVTGES